LSFFNHGSHGSHGSVRWQKWKGLLVVVFCFIPAVAAAQASSSGYVSIFGDYMPNRGDTAELRSRIFAEGVFDPTPKLLLTGSGFVEGLVAKRSTTRADGIFRVQELTVDYRAARADLFAGFGTMAWGRLDELQPTDVVNPLDVSRFFFEGRGEARMPVAFVRGRWFLSEEVSLEGVYVPFFRRGRFDQLDEPTSPFNLPSLARASVPLPNFTMLPVRVTEREPSYSLRNSQGGARVNATAGRVDWSVSAYRGIESFGLYRAGVPAAGVAFLPVDVVYPRFTMVGGDFETVRGAWGLRGEVAALVRDSFQDGSLAVVEGRSFEAGVGVDRRAGDYRVSGTVLARRESYDVPIDGEPGRTDVSLVLSADRSFARERYRVRAFTLVNPSEGSAFLRGVATWKVRDSVAVEWSGGWFAGDGRDLVGRFADSDFVYLRLKYYF